MSQGRRKRFEPMAVVGLIITGLLHGGVIVGVLLYRARLEAAQKPPPPPSYVVAKLVRLGKPRDEAEARATLERLAGRTHTVVSAAAMACHELGYEQARSQSTLVRFRELGHEEIARYVATREPMDKAGAYGIQGWGALLVDHIEGCYFSVMGLPLQALRELWLEFHARSRDLTKG